MKRFLLILLLILGCAATGFGGYWLAAHKMTAPADDVEAASPLIRQGPEDGEGAVSGSAADDQDPEVFDISFAACGDNLINSYLYNQAQARTEDDTYDFSYCYKWVARFFRDTDLNWINQETLVTDTLEPSSYPTFSSPGAVGQALHDINFRVFNISTNHTYDKGVDGLTDTVAYWKKMKDALAVGLVKNDVYEKIPIKTVNGVKFAFLSYTYGTNGLSTPSGSKTRVIYLSETDVIKKQVKLARKNADVVIVSCHWGTEDSHTITDYQRSLAKQLTGWGADLIIGTHPHVIQDCEWVKSKGRKAFCAYSLGNFLSGQSKTDNLIGAVLSLNFEVKEDLLEETYTVKIKKPKLIPTVTDYRPGFQDIHVEWLKDYTKELADSHGVRSAGGYNFNYEYIFDMLKNNVNKKYLDLPNQ